MAKTSKSGRIYIFYNWTPIPRGILLETLRLTYVQSKFGYCITTQTSLFNVGGMEFQTDKHTADRPAGRSDYLMHRRLGLRGNPLGLRREYVIRILMRVVTGDWNVSVSRITVNGRSCVGVWSSTLKNPTKCLRRWERQYVQLLQSTCISASCKWRNRQFIGYTLRPLERNVRGRLFDFEGGGGGGCQILFVRIIYFRHELGREIYFHVAWARENLFSCKHGKPQSTEAVNY